MISLWFEITTDDIISQWYRCVGCTFTLFYDNLFHSLKQMPDLDIDMPLQITQPRNHSNTTNCHKRMYKGPFIILFN